MRCFARDRLGYATVLILASLLLILHQQVPIANAATITVNSTCNLADAIKASNTDAASGGCSAGSGVDTISLTGSITLSAALPTLTTGVTINGGGHEINGGSSQRIFNIATVYNADANASAQRIFTINNLTLRNGSSSEGGAIKIAGARSDNLASLTLSNCNIYSSSSSGHGGAIHARNALLNVGPSTLLSGNSATHSGGGIWADSSTVNVTGGSTLTYNSAGLHGGSLYAIDSALTLQNVSVTHSSATEDGGGIAYFNGNNRTITIAHTVINDNSTSKTGGGIYANLSGSATLTISYTTMYNNSDQSGGNDYNVTGYGTFTLDGAAA